jgi:PAS domain S-box-containing protein
MPSWLLHVILVIARDISRRKKNEKQLSAAYDNLETVVVERTKNLTLEIEERRSTEKALKDSEARFRDIAESASEWIWEMDENFRYTYMSDRAYETYGWEAGYPIGKTRFDLTDEGSWAIDRRAMSEHHELFERHEEFKDIEVTVFTKDSQKFDTLISGKPIFSSTGDFSGYRGIARDVSERMKIETELRKKEKISRVFLDATIDKVILLDAEGVVLDANEAMVTRLKISKEQIIGKNIFNILLDQNNVDFDSIDVRRNKLREVVREAKTVSLIEQTPTEWFETLFYPVIDEAGKVVNVAVFGKNITQQKQIEQTLRKAKNDADVANRSKTEFLANMSHELRSPLTAILGFTEAMKEEIFGPMENEKYADYIDIHGSLQNPKVLM